jgi:hypothetical protein
MANMTDYSGAPAMSDIETGFWGLFPLLFLIAGIGGIAWLIVRDRDR